MSKAAIFWDRDDTLIADPGYLDDPGKVELLPGSAEAVRRLAEAGFENIIVTNQSGVARGLFDEATLQKIHERVRELFSQAGATIDAIYHCPYLPGDEAVVERYRRDSDLRKPRPGMLLQASLERKVDLASSWSIGNSLRDAQAGRGAGTRTIMIIRDEPDGQKQKELERNPAVDFVVGSPEQAVEIVLKHTRSASPAGGKKQTGGDAAATLDEILSFLRMVDRRSQHEDFSLSRLAGTVIQLGAIAAFLWSVFGWVFLPEELLGNHLMRVTLAVFLQMLALTFFVISSRAR
ncbi:MAG TPA: HAD family hydrolase [Phycisphaerae bacterium]|nr:HAD family hydrolase [Phycisphaerae bacterium]